MPDLAILDTADRIGRTAYLWLRQQAVLFNVRHSPGGSLHDDREAHLLVAGFISGLCDSLQLTLQHGLLAAYAYALLEGSDSNSLTVAAILYDADSVPLSDSVFEQGRSMAAQMLDQLADAGFSASSGQDAGRRMSGLAC